MAQVRQKGEDIATKIFRREPARNDAPRPIESARPSKDPQSSGPKPSSSQNLGQTQSHPHGPKPSASGAPMAPGPAPQQAPQRPPAPPPAAPPAPQGPTPAGPGQRPSAQPQQSSGPRSPVPPRPSAGSPGEVPLRPCKHSGCSRYAVEGSTFCDIHSCPLCQSDKPSGELKCKRCQSGQGKVSCKYVSAEGLRCSQPPEHISTFCRLHLCPSCGGSKPSNDARCRACRERCIACGGETAAGQPLCGTCKGLGPADVAARQAYITDQARKRTPAPNRYLFIWDFDKTITRQHVSDNSAGTHHTPESITANLVDGEFFKKCIHHLNGYGHHTKIATWADGDRAQWVVSQYLTLLFGPNEQRTVMHNEGIEAFQPGLHNMNREGKNAHIRNLVRQINSQGALLHETRVVLFDDREENIRMARNSGFNAVHCPDGFTRQVWRKFTDACGSSCLPEFLELTKIAASLPPPPEPPTSMSQFSAPSGGMMMSPPPPIRPLHQPPPHSNGMSLQGYPQGSLQAPAQFQPQMMGAVGPGQPMMMMPHPSQMAMTMLPY